ncbi:MAG: methyltransferase [Epsilonproteobacteria bacterium]|nr:MAG: methyltransferase [Campylobacterota bacterium]
MNVQTEFSKYADHYGSYNIIQKQVITKMLDDLDDQPERILDLGCGDGALYESLKWKPVHFVGVDFAPGMLELHPKGEGIECVYGDFNDSELFGYLNTMSFDRVFSASALQWANDLDRVLANLSLLNTPVSFAIFTANTFQTLFQTAQITPVLRNTDKVREIVEKYFDAKFEVLKYTLEFESTRDMFRYIKRSGVSGGRRALDYKQTKRLMQEYPLDYLEFEVLFIHS